MAGVENPNLSADKSLIFLRSCLQSVAGPRQRGEVQKAEHAWVCEHFKQHMIVDHGRAVLRLGQTDPHFWITPSFIVLPTGVSYGGTRHGRRSWHKGHDFLSAI